MMGLSTFWLVIGSLVLLLLLRLPPVLAVGLAGGVGLLLSPLALRVDISSNVIYSALNEYILLAVVFLFLTSSVLARAGAGDALYRLSAGLVGARRGGAALATLLATVLFAAVSANPFVTSSAVGAAAVPVLQRSGYSRGAILGLMTTCVVLAAMTPPSILYVLYAHVANISVVRIFLAGYAPTLVLLLSAVVFTTFSSAFARTGDGSPGVASYGPLLSVGWAAVPSAGMFLGIFTLSEAAALMFLAASVASLLTGTLSREELGQALLQASGASAALLLMVAMTSLLIYSLSVVGFRELGELATGAGTPVGRVVLSLAILLIIVLAMTLLDVVAAILLVPIFVHGVLPAIGIARDLDLWAGILVFIVLLLGSIAPPAGTTLRLHPLLVELRSDATARSDRLAMPLLLLALTLFVCWRFPTLVSFLPELMLGLP